MFNFSDTNLCLSSEESDSDDDMVPEGLVDNEMSTDQTMMFDDCDNFDTTLNFTDAGYGTAMDTTHSRFSSIEDPPLRKQLLLPDLTNFDSFLEATMTEPLENHQAQEHEYVEDLQPSEARKLEYSYRSEELIRNHYFGPSYWKFFSKKKNKEPTPDDSVPKRRKLKLTRKVSVEDLQSLDDLLEESLKSGPRASRKFVLPLKKLRRWPLKKIRLPPDFQIPADIFSKPFENAWFGLHEKIENYIEKQNDLEPNDEEIFDNYDNDYNEHDNEHETPEPLPNFQSNIFQTTFKPLTYATKAKNFNIKAIKELSLTVIMNESQTGENNIKFTSVSAKVSKMNKSTSCALNFLALLQATNEGKLDLLQENDKIDDFQIKYCLPLT